MPFRFKARRPVARELRQLVRGELDKAIDALRDATSHDEAIHDARKRLKKVRAALRLLHDALGADYDGYDVALREVAHTLARLRDAAALRETFAALRGRYASVIGPPLARRVEAALDERVRDHMRQASRVRRDASMAIEATRDAIVVAVASAAGRRAIRDGLERAYRRARRTTPAAGLEAGAADFHLWRRRVKDFWYQVRLFERLSPDARRAADTLERLEQALGDDHNLTCLRDAIESAPQRFGDATSVAAVLGCISRRQRALRERALALGPLVFTRSKRTIHEDVRRWSKELRK